MNDFGHVEPSQEAVEHFHDLLVTRSALTAGLTSARHSGHRTLGGHAESAYGYGSEQNRSEPQLEGAG